MKNKKLLSKLQKDKSYQLEYAAGRKQMYDKKSRKIKGERMVSLLGQFFSKNEMKKMSLLDIGGSTGIIDMVLAKYFKSVICSDIDNGAIEFAKEKFRVDNLSFIFDDIMNSNFKNNSFDVIICTHVYEHVPNQRKLFQEMNRILKPRGVCYLAATNKIQIIEPHYNLPFLSLLPKNIANSYIRFAGKAKKYHETPKTYWFLQKIARKFEVIEFTEKIIKQPKKFGYEDSIVAKFPIYPVAYLLSPLAKYFSPTFIWILRKKS